MIVIGNIADKIKNLKTEYKKTKDRDKGTGTGRIVHKFFKELDEVLGPHPATQPAVLAIRELCSYSSMRTLM